MIELQPVDRVDVTIVVDTFVDLLMAPSEEVARYALTPDWYAREQLVAEHGFSALVTVHRRGARQSVLYDGGLTPLGLSRNLSVMDFDPTGMRAIAISHGHVDHHGGLEGLFTRFGRQKLPLVIHPEAWRERRIVFPTGAEVRMPPPKRRDLEKEGVEVIEERQPTFLVDNTVLISGQVERTTDFETGFPIHQARAAGGEWEPDPMIWDDQNLVVNVRDRGLVVVSGCSHAGAVNVLRNARALTGVERIAGFIGGFHLTGAVFEPIIERTIAEFAALGVGRVVPGHCTGWKAVHALARAMPSGFVQPSVGTTVSFGAAG